MATDTVIDIDPEQVFDKYDIQSKFTDLTIITKDKKLYYTRYNLIKQSEYFFKKFNGFMGDASDNVIYMQEHDSSLIEIVLTLLDDGRNKQIDKLFKPFHKQMEQLMEFLNYYCFGKLLDKIFHRMQYIDNTPPSFINFLAHEKFIDGVHGFEFRYAVDDMISTIYIEKLLKKCKKKENISGEMEKLAKMEKYVSVGTCSELLKYISENDMNL